MAGGPVQSKGRSQTTTTVIMLNLFVQRFKKKTWVSLLRNK